MNFIPAAIVAELTGFTSGEAFLRVRDRLEKENDFPVPMPTTLRPMLWRRSAIEAWVSQQGQPSAVVIPPGSNVVLLDEARRS